jgi:hypothetical protein
VSEKHAAAYNGETLDEAFREFYRLEREESAAFGLYYELCEKRAEAAKRVRELGGRL